MVVDLARDYFDFRDDERLKVIYSLHSTFSYFRSSSSSTFNVILQVGSGEGYGVYRKRTDSM